MRKTQNGPSMRCRTPYKRWPEVQQNGAIGCPIGGATWWRAAKGHVADAQFNWISITLGAVQAADVRKLVGLNGLKNIRSVVWVERL